MAADDIAGGLRLCRLSGWDQVARDWERFFLPSSEAIAAVRGDRIVGTCGAIRYGRRFAWIGMVLVDPDAQGQGVGASLLNGITQALEDLPAIRLDATPAGYPLYVKRGFVEERRLSRLARGIVHRSLAPRPADVRPMTAADLDDVSAMDEEVFGAPRRELLEWMHEGAPGYAFVARRGPRLAGYVLGRRGFAFDHLGPLVAASTEAAMHLVTACLADGGDRPFIIDAARHDFHWLEFLERAGFAEQRPYIRMYRGGELPFGDAERQFAMLGPEFG